MSAAAGILEALDNDFLHQIFNSTEAITHSILHAESSTAQICQFDFHFKRKTGLLRNCWFYGEIKSRNKFVTTVSDA